MNEQWGRFYDEVDNVVPLAVRHISHDESDIEPQEDVTWVDKYETHDLRKMQLINNQILLVASTSTGCVVGCGLLSEG